MDKLKSKVKIAVEILLILGLVIVIRLSILNLLPNTTAIQGESQPTYEDIGAQNSYPYPDIPRETWEAAQPTNLQHIWDGTQTYPEATVAEATARAALTAMPQPSRDASQPYPDMTPTEATGMVAPTAMPQAYPGPSHTPQQPLMNTSTPMPLLLANGWYSYTELTTGFSISYPEDTYFYPTYNDFDNHFQGVQLVFHMPGDYGMSIVFHENPKKLSVEEYAKSDYQEAMGNPAPADFIAGFSNTSVGGLPALKVMPPGLFPYVIYLVKDNTIITIGPNARDGYADPNNNYGDAAQELFKKILATVSFKPPQ